MVNKEISLLWFRQDLRLSDNPALIAAAACNLEILPIYIHDNLSPQEYAIGSASKIYLYNSLTNLNKSLSNKLNIYTGDPLKILIYLLQKYNIKQIFWNRCYEPWLLSYDEIITKQLKPYNTNCIITNGSYLWDPSKITKDDGSYYKVFSAYKRKVYSLHPSKPLSKPQFTVLQDIDNKRRIDDLQLIPNHKWAEKIIPAADKISFGASQGLNKYLFGKFFNSGKKCFV